ncbi:TetR/AcrR family transcriptional regulator [Tistlia consotensis]|uniref:TetR/AcrR family transcriptional regulator n=1 Tax=Tistlia consotensis TaxID=1321365 RepID=UPI000A150F13|nr:TetR/AcrR family transcriptional regulator [Tistlia consotensis]
MQNQAGALRSAEAGRVVPLPTAAPARPRRDTREQILDVAEAAVLDKGFGATSIEEVIAAVGITKSGFFYHFRDKGVLATALLERYLEREEALFDELFGRADELHEDPLHGFLVGLKLLAETMADLPNGHPGCLVAAVCYQENLFNREVHALNAAAVLRWRRRFRARFDAIAERHPPRVPIDFDDLADMLSALADGGIILSKVLREPDLLPRQILLYRSFVHSVFLDA